VDVFLLDIEMPAMSGLSLCKALRNMDKYKLAPILFLTGTNSNIDAAFAAGCDDVLGKPVDPLILRARLTGHVRRMEDAQKLERIEKMLDHYISKRTREIVKTAAQKGSFPPPVYRDVAILFTDVRGFTALSEDIDAHRLFSLVSTQLAIQVDLVYRHGGYVDKYGGDGLLAVFDHDENENRAVQASLCALEIMAAARRSTTGDPRIRQLGIGINSGRVVVGNIGSSDYFDYTVIGNAVNLAARLCGHAAPMSIVVSKAVRDAALMEPRLRFHSERAVTVRGIKDPVSVYELSAAEPLRSSHTP